MEGIDVRELDQHFLVRAYTAARRSIPSCDWDAFAAAIALDRSRFEGGFRKPEPEIDRTLFAQLDGFRRLGVARFPFALGGDAAAAMRSHLESQPVYGGAHVLGSDVRWRPLDKLNGDAQLVGYTPDQLLRTPGLVDVLNHPAIVDFIELYLGCVPTLYSVNGWWSFPARSPQRVNVQFFHRDNDDWRFCTLFLYLTDVDQRTGPHQIILGSHTLPGTTALLDEARSHGRDVTGFDARGSFTEHFGEEFSARCEHLFAERIETIAGPAGTMFLANTLALHRGLLPVASPRLILWARYGLGPNTNSDDLAQGPLARGQVSAQLADTPRNRYVNRLLFEYDRGGY
jgi:hypothetical protein